MLPQMDAISLSYFRQNMSKCLDLVTVNGGNIWLMKHRKPVAAVVSMKDVHVLGEVQGRSGRELRNRLEVNLERMLAARAIEDDYDRIKLAKGEWVSSDLIWEPGA